MSSAPPGSPAATPDAALVASLAKRFRGLVLVLGLGYGTIFLLSAALVAYMRRTRSGALRGDSNAARKVLLPAFLPLLVVLMVVSLAYAIYFCVLRLTMSETHLSGTAENEVYYSGRLFFLLLVILFMYEKSVSTPALRRAVLYAMLLATYNVPVVWLTDVYCDETLAYWIPQFSRVAIVLFFLWVLIMPPARASKRTLREYCVFVLVYLALFFGYTEMFHQGKTDEGFALTYANLLWGSFCPLVIWRVLKADTEYWRGLGRRAVALQSLFRQKHRMDERISSRGLHVLIEMHRKFIIDFAYLEVKRKIGVGASAVVFNGVLHSRTPVAIKVYTPVELTDDVVAEFSHEAALCGALHHPNVVKFYGMCVCPPTICLVSELCQGNLDDVTRAIARRAHDMTRQQLLINLHYMLDATRAVAYLHSFSPAFLHRDIKPANFLVDRHGVVKLTDFGESRSLPRACGGPGATPSASSRGV
ncbi:hypothetical protein P43SY_011254 [Pythium insidiosum]|uniref:Protein kinase domain-containing protein n=1 Tax=Pythium insidiosum TaxID=114742 RepID=A0AAD5Q4X0_PYTIN|nr:hypothetical protein P43SY_011254 [Pythium insidiosum]